MSENAARRRHQHPRPRRSCAVCHRRKVRCNNQQPCDQCIRQHCEPECQFDGIGPSASLRNAAGATVSPTPAIVSSTESANPSGVTGQEGDGASSRGGEPSTLLTAESSHTTVNRRPSPAVRSPGIAHHYATHDWIDDTLVRGRSHSSWIYALFDPLTASVHQGDAIDGHVHDKMSGILSETQRNAMRQRLVERENPDITCALPDELPPAATSRALMTRYFETFNSVYCIVDEYEFGNDFDAVINHPSSVRPSLIIQVLLMIGLASATYPVHSSPISRDQVLSWLNVASTMPTSSLELDDLTLETLRCILLLNLGKQILKFNETADCVYSAAGIRCSMLLGLHKLTPQTTMTTDARCGQALLFTARDLELHACLAAGMPPTGFRDNTPFEQHPFDQIDPCSNEDFRRILIRSLPVRSEIVATLNAERHLSFEKVAHLSRELTRAMSRTSTSNNNDWPISFPQIFVEFIYRKFLLALHRPFAIQDSTAFHLSASICIQHSRILMMQLCRGFQLEADPSPEHDTFSSLIAGNGTFIRAEAINSILHLAYELYRDDGTNLDLQAALQPAPEDSRSVLRRMMEEWIPFAERSLHSHDQAGITLLIPSIVLAHIDALNRQPEENEE